MGKQMLDLMQYLIDKWVDHSNAPHILFMWTQDNFFGMDYKPQMIAIRHEI